MESEVHVYTLGMDPFMLRMGDITIFIHQGKPNSDTPPMMPPATSPEIYKLTTLGGLYENYIVAPTEARDVGLVLEAQDSDRVNLGVALSHGSPTGASGDQLRALLEGVSEYDAGDVSVHVVSLDALDPQVSDG